MVSLTSKKSIETFIPESERSAYKEVFESEYWKKRMEDFFCDPMKKHAYSPYPSKKIPEMSIRSVSHVSTNSSGSVGKFDSEFIPCAYGRSENPGLIFFRWPWKLYTSLRSDVVAQVKELQVENEVAIFALPSDVYATRKIVLATKGFYEDALRTGKYRMPKIDARPESPPGPSASYKREESAGEWS